jgi:hypothetical protein
MLAGGVVGTWFLFNSAGPPISTKTEKQAYQQPATRIEIDIESGDVRVVGGASQVSLERRLEFTGPMPTITETWRGDTLVIRARCELSGLERARNERCAVFYVVRVPAAVTVDAKVGMGSIRIDDVDGELRLTNDFGDVEIRNARGRVRVRSSGKITATGLRGTEAIADSGGDVSLDFAAAPGLVRAVSEFGTIDVALPRGDNGAMAYLVRVETTFGQRYVDVSSDPASLHQVFAAAAGQGDVYVRYSSG